MWKQSKQAATATVLTQDGLTPPTQQQMAIWQGPRLRRGLEKNGKPSRGVATRGSEEEQENTVFRPLLWLAVVVEGP